MKELYSIGEAAKLAGMTSETLRHYDRIGLVRPGEKDAWTGYRYYTQEEIVRLHTIQALRCMDLPLAEIKRVLELNNLDEVAAFFRQAEQRADEKILKLRQAKEKIRAARTDYERKIAARQAEGVPFVQQLPKRVLLLSDTLEQPTLETLWQYHRHFYGQLRPEERDSFAFADLAGLYTEGGRTRLFAVCTRYPDKKGLTVLPAGTYLCANCTAQNRASVLRSTAALAQAQYGADTAFTVQLIVISGILQWTYQVQFLVEPAAPDGCVHSD